MRQFIIFICILLILGINVYSQDFNTFIDKFIANQKKVISLVCHGTTNINVYDSNGNVLQSMDSGMTIYLKAPDLFKLVITDPVQVVIVQKGSLQSQKIEGYDQVTTKQVNETSDLFKKYFSYGLTENTDEIQIIDSSVVTENGNDLFRFKMKIDNVPAAQIKIDYIDVYFNENGMIVRIIVFSSGKETIRTDTNYILQNSIYVATRIQIVSNINGMKTENILLYSSVNVNTAVSDKEFEL